MSEPKHTPGPWKTRKGFSSFGIEIYRPNPKIKKPFYPSALAEVDLDDSSRKTVAESRANARLIAAAPELLEALKAIVPAPGYNPDWWCPQCRELKHGSRVTSSEHCEDCGTFLGDKQPGDEWIEKARAAIAKAEGGAE